MSRRYWMLICNPRRWAVDAFIADGMRDDSWLVRPGDEGKVKSGDLAFLRVGNDSRTLPQLQGRRRLSPGIYALCRVTSDPRVGDGSSSSYGYDDPDDTDSNTDAGRLEVGIALLRTFLDAPLLLSDLARLERPLVESKIVKGFQASSTEVPAEDFARIASLLGTTEAALAEADAYLLIGDSLIAVPTDWASLDPRIVARQVNQIERGPAGERVKHRNGYRCQLCDSLGLPATGFVTRSGKPYVEAHHAIPVAQLVPGTLHESYIMTLCANHHRQLHFGQSVAVKLDAENFLVSIDGRDLRVRRSL